MALKDMRPGSIAKSLRMIKGNIAQLKRTQKALKSEYYNYEAENLQSAIDILEKMWNY